MSLHVSRSVRRDKNVLKAPIIVYRRAQAVALAANDFLDVSSESDDGAARAVPRGFNLNFLSAILQCQYPCRTGSELAPSHRAPRLLLGFVHIDSDMHHSLSRVRRPNCDFPGCSRSTRLGFNKLKSL